MNHLSRARSTAPGRPGSPGKPPVSTPTWRYPPTAGRPSDQLVDTAALALGRTARAAVPGRRRDSLLTGRRGRAVVGVARGGSRCADTLGDDLLDDHDAFSSLAAQPHLVTGQEDVGLTRMEKVH